MTGNRMPLEPAEPGLVLERDRDAYATIRGFVYQVDLTIQRWLDLCAGEALELERGEDIDRLSSGLLGGGPDGWERLMEQVKRRDGPITLRSGSVRSALSNFYEHYRLNLDLNLRFRFTTNAPPGRERQSSLAGRERGIEVWQRIAASGEEPANQESLVAALRELLLRARKPDDIRTESWDAWQAFVEDSSTEEFLAFLRRVEIATRTADSASLRQVIEERLLRDGHANNADHASQLYKALFASVFARLSERGLKRLTRDDLEAEVVGTGPGSIDRALLAKLDVFRAFVEERLSRVEEGLDDVRAEVGGVRAEVGTLAIEVASRRAPIGAHAGDTRSFQLTANYFGAELDSGSTFNHARALIGRAEVLDDALTKARAALSSSSGGIVVIGGTGGVGKSRVMIAIAEQLESERAAEVRWVRDRTTPDIDSLNELPPGPVVLLCDDAHRRSDLEALLSLGEARSDPTLIVLGTRPRGRDALRVAAFHAGIGWDRVHDLGDLGDLPRDDLLALVRIELGPDDQTWAEAIVQITHGSTLVSVVAARLLRTRRLNPGILAQDREANDLIFAGFEDEIYGRIGNEVDTALAKRTLELLAAIAPVSMSDDNLVERAATHLGTDDATLRRVVGVLQEAGVLREQRRGVRIIPDVLSDHILHRTLVAGARATRAERVILDHMGTSVLPSVLRNVGELDWQIQAAHQLDGIPVVDVFSEVWERFVETFRAATNSERATYLERLRPVAAFQPAPVLALCEWIIENPHGEDSTQWGTTFGSDSVLAKVPTLLATLAEHEEYFDRAVDLLWHLGRSDHRELNPYPEHAIRTLNDVVAYAPRRYIWRQERAIAALKRWTLQSGWSEQAHSPLGVATAVLRTAMVEDRYDLRTNTISMTRYGVDAEVTRRPREAAIALLTDLALGPEPRGRIWAVEGLLEALQPPESQFGHVVTDEEEGGFRLQYEAAFNAIERIAAESEDALVRVKLRDGLQWVPRRTRLAWKQESARQLIDRLPENEEMVRVRVWGRLFRESFQVPAQGYERIRELREELTRQTASGLLREAGDAQGIIDYIVAEHSRFQSAHMRAEPGYLLAAIAEARPDIAVELADWIVDADEGSSGVAFAPWLPVLLMMLREKRVEDYARLLGRALSSGRSDLRWSAAGTLARVGDPQWNDQERSHARTLLADANPRVRAEAVEAIGRIPAGQRAEFVESIEIGGDPGVARAVAELWAYRPAEDRVRISEKEAKRILDALVELPDLGHPQGELDQMLAVFARWHPLHVLEFILERAARETDNAAHAGEDGYARYDAVPYTGFQGVWGALQGAAEYPAIVRRLLEALAEETRRSSVSWVRGTMDVVRRIMLWDNEVERAIREWMDAGKCEEVALVDALLSDQPSLFVVDHRDFLTDLLIWARGCRPEERERIERALLTSTLRTIQARRRGEVNELDLRLRDQARGIAEELARGAADRRPAAAFFETVASEAEHRLASATQRDERSVAEELEWEDED